MIIPYDPEELFETRDNFDIVSFDDGILIIDNWYKNYNGILDILSNTPVPIWKRSSGGRNFIDYYDCRPSLNVNFPTDKTRKNLQIYYDLLYQYYQINQAKIITRLYDFNFYKNIKKGIGNNIQHRPHVDGDVNCLIYLDPICSGGTAIYEINEKPIGQEDDNLLVDISSYNKKIIKAKPNRMVMFRGEKYHGGYIEDHDRYVDQWRMNQVILFEKIS